MDVKVRGVNSFILFESGEEDGAVREVWCVKKHF